MESEKCGVSKLKAVQDVMDSIFDSIAASG